MNDELLPPPNDKTITQKEYQGWLKRLKEIQTTKHQQPTQPYKTTPYNPPPITLDQTHIPNKIPFNIYTTDRRWHNKHTPDLP